MGCYGAVDLTDSITFDRRCGDIHRTVTTRVAMRGGLYASCSGRGKTFVVLMLCATDKLRRQSPGPATATDLGTLVVVPLHLLDQWRMEPAYVVYRKNWPA